MFDDYPRLPAAASDHVVRVGVVLVLPVVTHLVASAKNSAADSIASFNMMVGILMQKAKHSSAQQPLEDALTESPGSIDPAAGQSSIQALVPTPHSSPGKLVIISPEQSPPPSSNKRRSRKSPPKKWKKVNNRSKL